MGIIASHALFITSAEMKLAAAVSLPLPLLQDDDYVNHPFTNDMLLSYREIHLWWI
jgi:hypothetical protein